MKEELKDESAMIDCFLMIMGDGMYPDQGRFRRIYRYIEYIDTQEILHENFYLLPVGFLLMFAGLIVILTTFSVYLAKRLKNQE